MARYTVVYDAYLFHGDKNDGLNFYETDSWDDAIHMWHFYHDDMYMVINDNEYGVTFDGDWS